jgi:hypothetical protein
MGRGKGDGFAQVFGARRGRLASLTIVARNPTPEALAELERLVADPGFCEDGEALEALYAHRDLIDERPLLGRLSEAMCLAQARQVVGTRAREARFLGLLAGLRDGSSEQIFYDASDMLHLCPRGREHPLEADLTTICGISLGRTDICRTARGTWQDLAGTVNRHCPECEAQATSCPDSQERAEDWPALSDEDGEALAQEVAGAIRERLMDLLARGQRPSIEDLQEGSEHKGALLGLLAQRLHEGGPAAAYHALGAEQHRRLCRELRTAPDAALLDEEDWRDHLEFYMPLRGVPQGTEAERLRDQARVQLYAMMASAAKHGPGHA